MVTGQIYFLRNDGLAIPPGLSETLYQLAQKILVARTNRASLILNGNHIKMKTSNKFFSINSYLSGFEFKGTITFENGKEREFSFLSREAPKGVALPWMTISMDQSAELRKPSNPILN